MGGLRIIELPPHFPIERLDTAWRNKLTKSVVLSYEEEISPIHRTDKLVFVAAHLEVESLGDPRV